MRLHQAIKITVVGNLLLIGVLIAMHLSQAPPKLVKREAKRTTDTQPQPSETAAPVLVVELNPKRQTVQPPMNPWQGKFNILIDGREELFGPDGEERLKELQDFVESIATTNLPVVLKELQEFQAQKPTVFGHELQLHLLRRWAEKDVHPATDWISQMPTGGDQQEALAAAANAWAGQNFADAAAWAKQLPDSSEQQIALESIADEAVCENPLEALRLAVTLAPSSKIDGIVGRSIAVWTRSAPDEAISWAKQIPDEGWRERAIMSAATTWAESNPVAAANLAITCMRPGALQDRTVIAITQCWVLIDAPGATAWVNQFPEGVLRQAAILTINKATKYIPPIADVP
jgi:hypothetical protein